MHTERVVTCRGVCQGVANWPWTPESIAGARHALPFYNLQADTPEMALQSFWGWPPRGRVAFSPLPPWTPHAVSLW
jgi:hypothetical protein